MSKIGIVLDSTVYLSKKEIEKNNIDVVPLNVLEGDHVYPETSITPQFIFDGQDQGKKFTTSQPAPPLFKEAFDKKLEQEGYDYVVALVLSKGISGTYQSALLARDSSDHADKIFVLDANNAGFGNELLALRLIELIEETGDINKVISGMEHVIENCGLMFTVENLFALQKGGRLSKTQALLGTVLRVKPVIGLIDGKLKLVHKERTMKRLYHYMIKEIQESIGDKKKLVVRFIHQKSPESMNTLKDMMLDVFDNIEFTMTDYLGPVFSIHIGRKGFGVAWYTED